ncbi:MAG: hypothetical protein DHS20C07_28750 [Methyloligella sp.]|nr:MAG: hypothetical protein DHS20C07_28750 [Methyloligella sp.]
MKNDINGYLKYEGKNDDQKELLKVLYGSVKDINSKLSKYLIFFVIFNIYIVNYTFDLGLDFAIAGIKLDSKIEVLAGMLIICLFMRYFMAILSYNRKVITTSIKAILDSSIDVQLIGTYRSAYLYFENAEVYKPGNDPGLIPQTLFMLLALIFIVLALATIMLIEISIIYIYLKALILIIETSKWPMFLNWILSAGLIGTLGASLFLSWYSYSYLRYTDWTSTSKIKLLQQIDEKEADAFRKEIYQEECRISILIDCLEKRIKLL